MKNEEMIIDTEKLNGQKVFETPVQADEFTNLVFRAVAKRCIPEVLGIISRKYKLNKKELSQVIGCSISTLNTILSGGATKMSDSTQDKIYEVCAILNDNKDVLSKLANKEKVNFVKNIKLERESKGISTELVFVTPEFSKWFNEEWPTK